MPITATNWQKYGRRRWMKKAGVVKWKSLYTQRFVLADRSVETETREYTLPDGTMVFEQYTFWHGDQTEVVMVALQPIDAYRLMKLSGW